MCIKITGLSSVLRFKNNHIILHVLKAYIYLTFFTQQKRLGMVVMCDYYSEFEP